ncbi:MAG: type III-B CRISPR module RAMP protein Cmr6 [Magnetococcales bacterium]|nr:type III-B CRISPR module RAMP protein Cmr6 [Magnetococcales bacterium]
MKTMDADLIIDHRISAHDNALSRLLATAPELTKRGNAGLIFDRYLPLWQWNTGKRTIERRPLFGPLRAFVDDFNAEKNKDHPGNMVLKEQRLRREWMKKRLSMQQVLGEVEWRLAMGLGNDHPSENGFTFEPVSGVPVLPGSAIKGVCRRMAVLQDWDPRTIERWFGPEITPDDSANGRGALIFMDAWPTKWPRLVVDIVNCHHPRYYAQPIKDKADFPSETESPVPVLFLALDQGSRFAFPIRQRPGSKIDLEEAGNLLITALETLGLGAKRASGYGLMRQPRRDE